MYKYIAINCNDSICYHAQPISTKEAIEAVEDLELTLIRWKLNTPPEKFTFNEITEEWEWQRLSHSHLHPEFINTIGLYMGQRHAS